MAKREITQEILEAVRIIPPCTLGMQSNKGAINTLIKIFYTLKIVVKAILLKLVWTSVIKKFIRAIIAIFKANHGFVYWGSGKHETVDALVQGVRRSNLLEKIRNGSGLRLYYNKNITTENMQLAKAYSYGTVGRNYGYIDFASFVTRLVSAVFPKSPVKLKPHELMDTCIENQVKTMDIALTGKMNTPSEKLLPGKDRSEIHPQELTNWLETEEAKNAGWVNVFYIKVDFTAKEKSFLKEESKKAARRVLKLMKKKHLNC